MNNVQEALIEISKALIQNKKIVSWENQRTDWNKIIEEAQAHQILGMLYPVIDRKIIEEQLSDEARNKWKKITFLNAREQLYHIQYVAYLISLFKDKGIEIIALKGLVIRELYVRPELRTMCDADLLAKKEDLSEINSILLEQGYQPQERSIVHIQYTCPYHCTVEIHWTIKDERFFKTVDYPESILWNGARPIQIGGIETFSFGLEDLLLHICVHMATHLLVGGFGLRQLIDLSLLIKNKGDEIQWSEFCDKVKCWGLEAFVVTLFSICKNLFEVPVSSEIEHLGIIKQRVVKELIEDILKSGVYGKKDRICILSNELARGTESETKNSQLDVLKNYKAFFFPSISQLSDKYTYVKKYPILLPIGWIHRLWNGIMDKKYKVTDKVRFLLNAYRLSYKKNKLLKQLKL